MINTRHIQLLIPLLVSLLLYCNNPFLPESGKPIHSSSRRTTPQKIIDQLVESYVNKRIELFIDLLPQNESYRFYVAPSFESMYGQKYNSSHSERPDQFMIHVNTAQNYFFWTQQQEVESHRKMFGDNVGIEFTSYPEISDVNYVIENDDTAYAEMLTTGGEFIISITISPSRVERYTASIERQVFLLGKDEFGLWVIQKWYDLSNAPSLD
ncbi:MAG: hypothetical protein Q4F84_07910 [Fibrobacter sp.]|nr:hypothetical protein [Fibrobacter sp.]